MISILDRNYKTIMKLLLMACLIVVASSQQTFKTTCKGIFFGSEYYDVEILKEGLNKVHQLILNSNDNTLYFAFEQDAELPTSDVGYLNIETREVGVINGIKNASAIAIDQQYNKVYVGGQNGIFKINNINKSPERLAVHENIQSMYFKEVLFYINRRKEAYMYNNGRINPVFELQSSQPEKLILDDDHNIFFTEGKGLFRVKLGTRVVNTHERYRTNILTTDVDGKPYIVTNDGIYTYNKYKYAFDKVSEMTGLKGLSFNKFGDPIYCVVDYLIKLQHNPNKCFEPIV